MKKDLAQNCDAEANRNKNAENDEIAGFRAGRGGIEDCPKACVKPDIGGENKH